MRSKKLTTLIISIFVFLLIPLQAYAYLDPGSGSMIVGIIIALVATLFYFLKSFIYEKVRYIFKGKKEYHNKKYGIVFYSEAKHYWNVFYPIIKELDNRNIKCSYFTSDKDDPGLQSELSNVEKIYIGESYEAFFFLNKLQADFVMTTTPGLNVLQIKRSKKVKHYCHIMHGIEDTSTYPPYGVDYFDSVLVNGEHQVAVIRELEESRNLTKKTVEIIGSTYLDVLKEQINPDIEKSDKITILLAPSWGEKGFIKKYGEILIDNLIKEDYNIILRPHPQSYKSEMDIIKKIENKFSNNKNLTWDNKPSGLESMQKSDLMISDFSGIIFDYLFLLSKPVIVTEFEMDSRKYDMNFLKSKQSTLMKLIKDGKIGYTLKEDEFSNIKDIVEKVKNDDSYSKYINEFKDKIYCFPGEAGKRGADFVEKISATINSESEKENKEKN